MVKANVNINGNSTTTDMEITGLSNEIKLELSLILMRIKATSNETYKDILESIKIIDHALLVDNIDVDELQNMFIYEYLKTLKKGCK